MEGIAWMNHAVRGHEDVFMASLGPHYPALVRRLTAVMRDHDTALDLAQEAYLRAYRSWYRFDGNDPRAWLYTIALRLAFNERRRILRWRGLLGRRRADDTWVAPEDN